MYVAGQKDMSGSRFFAREGQKRTKKAPAAGRGGEATVLLRFFVGQRFGVEQVLRDASG